MPSSWCPGDCVYNLCPACSSLAPLLRGLLLSLILLLHCLPCLYTPNLNLLCSHGARQTPLNHPPPTPHLCKPRLLLTSGPVMKGSLSCPPHPPIFYLLSSTQSAESVAPLSQVLGAGNSVMNKQVSMPLGIYIL